MHFTDLQVRRKNSGGCVYGGMLHSSLVGERKGCEMVVSLEQKYGLKKAQKFTREISDVLLVA
jgi:hypothetical protein